jgi:hypothetical protein
MAQISTRGARLWLTSIEVHGSLGLLRRQSIATTVEQERRGYVVDPVLPLRRTLWMPTGSKSTPSSPACDGMPLRRAAGMRAPGRCGDEAATTGRPVRLDARA